MLAGAAGPIARAGARRRGDRSGRPPPSRRAAAARGRGGSGPLPARDVERVSCWATRQLRRRPSHPRDPMGAPLRRGGRRVPVGEVGRQMAQQLAAAGAGGRAAWRAAARGAGKGVAGGGRGAAAAAGARGAAHRQGRQLASRARAGPSARGADGAAARPHARACPRPGPRMLPSRRRREHGHRARAPRRQPGAYRAGVGWSSRVRGMSVLRPGPGAGAVRCAACMPASRAAARTGARACSVSIGLHQGACCFLPAPLMQGPAFGGRRGAACGEGAPGLEKGGAAAGAPPHRSIARSPTRPPTSPPPATGADTRRRHPLPRPRPRPRRGAALPSPLVVDMMPLPGPPGPAGS
jgi:hypothetical protein